MDVQDDDAETAFIADIKKKIVMELRKRVRDHPHMFRTQTGAIRPQAVDTDAFEWSARLTRKQVV